MQHSHSSRYSYSFVKEGVWAVREPGCLVADCWSEFEAKYLCNILNSCTAKQKHDALMSALGEEAA